MKLRTLILIPLGWAGLYLLLSLVVYSFPGANESLRRLESPLSNMLMLAGCLVAVSKLNRGDYLRRAWLLFGLTPFLFLFFELGPFFRHMIPSIGFEVEVAQGALAIIANLTAIAGVVMFAHAWKVAELSLPGTSRARWLICISASLLALALVGPGIVHSFQNVAAGKNMAMSLMGIGSSFGDIVCLGLLAPLFLTAIALRGGFLSWPWIFFTSATVCWLAFDFAVTFATPAGFDPRTVDILYGVSQCLASGFTFSAGMVQRKLAEKIFQVTSSSK